MKTDDKDQQQGQSQSGQNQSSGQSSGSESDFGNYLNDRERQSESVQRTVRQDEQSTPLITKKGEGS